MASRIIPAPTHNAQSIPLPSVAQMNFFFERNVREWIAFYAAAPVAAPVVEKKKKKGKRPVAAKAKGKGKGKKTVAPAPAPVPAVVAAAPAAVLAPPVAVAPVKHKQTVKIPARFWNEVVKEAEKGGKRVPACVLPPPVVLVLPAAPAAPVFPPPIVLAPSKKRPRAPFLLPVRKRAKPSLPPLSAPPLAESTRHRESRRPAAPSPPSRPLARLPRPKNTPALIDAMVRVNELRIDWEGDRMLKYTNTCLWRGGTLGVSGYEDWEEDKKMFGVDEEEEEQSGGGMAGIERVCSAGRSGVGLQGHGL
jgi:hypothetical protein